MFLMYHGILYVDVTVQFTGLFFCVVFLFECIFFIDICFLMAAYATIKFLERDNKVILYCIVLYLILPRRGRILDGMVGGG